MSNVVQMRRRYPSFTFGERVRKVRRETGMTQAEFAEKLGVGRQAYAAWEVDKNTPPRIAEVAEKLEEITGVGREWFLGWVGPDGFEPSRSTVKDGRFAVLRARATPRMRDLAAAS